MNLLALLYLVGTFTSHSVMVEKFTLKNGLKVLLHRNPSKVVTVLAWIRVGYLDEPDSLVGISHVLEHLLFRGTEKRPGKTLLEDIREIGGYLNASTYYERTTVYLMVPKENLNKALDIMADILFNSSLNETDLLKEKEIIKAEVKRKLDNPTKYSFEKLLSLVFPNHRLSRFRTGYPEDIDRIKREQLIKWYKRYYVPNNITLVLSGGMDLDKTKEEIKKKFGGFKPYPLVKDEVSHKEGMESPKVVIERAPIEEPLLYIGFGGVGEKSAEKPVLDVLSYLLGGGESSVLSERLKEELNLINNVRAYNFSTREKGLFYIRMRLPIYSIEEAIDEFFNTLNQLKMTIKPSDILIAKKKLESELIVENEQNLRRALLLAKYEDLGCWEIVNEYLRAALRVNEREIIDAVDTYIKGERARVLLILPEHANFHIKENEIEKLLLKERKISLPLKDETALSPELPAFALFHEEQEEEGKIYIKRLGRFTVIVKEDHSFPVSAMGIFFEGGKKEEDAGKAGITRLALSTVLKGTKRNYGHPFRRLCDSLGLKLADVVEEDFFGIEAISPSSSYEEGFKLLLELAFDPAMRMEDFNLEKKELLSKIRTKKEDIEFLASELIRKSLFEGSSMAFSTYGDEESIAQLGYDETVKWYKERTRRNTLIVLSGDVDGEGVLNMLIKLIPSDGKPVSLKHDDFPPGPDEVERGIVPIERGESAVVVGARIPGRLSREFYSFAIIAEVLNGAGGRLWKKLRDELSISYLFRTGIKASMNSGLFYIIATTTPERVFQLANAMEDMVRDLLEKPLSSQELESAKLSLKGEYSFYLESNANVVEELARCHFAGLGVSEIENFTTKINSLTQDEIMSAIQNYLKSYKLLILRSSKSET